MEKFRLFKNQNLIGHCQLTYWTKNGPGQKIIYCLQDNGEKFGGIRLMRCSQDGEPSYEVKLKNTAIEFEIPYFELYDSGYTKKLKSLCKSWILKNANGFYA